MLLSVVVLGTAVTAQSVEARDRAVVKVRLGSRVIGHFHSNPISVSGVTAHSLDVRLLGATDMTGRAYEWAPYRWRRLRLGRGEWRGLLPGPALLGIYQVQLRLDHGRKLLTSRHWLDRVFPYGTEARPSFATPAGVIDDYVAHLPGHQVLLSTKPLPLAAYDHRDPRLHRFFAIAYAPRDEKGPRLGRFITTVREGFHGRWRLLDAAIQPDG
jgi:hypothetical protein